MKTKIHSLIIVLALLASTHHATAQGNAFTYQGRLNSGGSPASGTYNLTFTLFGTNTGGVPAAGPVSVDNVIITNGLFTVPVDFGPGVFTGTNDWLEIGVATNGGSFSTLAPRQELTPTPYAIYAEAVTASGISGTYANPVTFNNGADMFDGTFYGEFLGGNFIGGNFSGQFLGDGSGLINLNASQLASGTVPDARLAGNLARTDQVWLLNGNAGTTPGVNFVGTTDYQALELHVNGLRAVRLEPVTNTNILSAVNVIGGSPFNSVTAGVAGATIGGGGASTYSGLPAANHVLGDFNTIGGGWDNTTGTTNFDVTEATVAGGAHNVASGITAVIAGGANNLAYGNNATVAGGLQNRANYHSFVGSGYANSADGDEAMIGSGRQNTVQTNTGFCVIGGGDANTIQGNHYEGGATIGGGGQNTILPTSVYEGNNPYGNSSFSTISGGCLNQVLSNAVYSAIGGGLRNSVQFNDPYAVVGGGLLNTNGGTVSVIGGGQQNNTIGGDGAVVGGGYSNANGGSAGTIGGGADNVIGSAADHSTIGGGGSNTIIGSVVLSVYDTIGGGQNNTILTNTSFDVIGGGQQNTNSGTYSTIGGGFNNSVSNLAATIPGGYEDIASGNVSFAAGEFAQATNSGAFVWSDGSGQVTASATDNSVTMRGSGGFSFLTSSANPSPGAYLAPFATSWTALSDRNAKKDFRPVNCQAVLDKLARVPIEQWHYKWESSGATPNLGPMAQDFKAAFYPGRDDKGITTLEFDGVELAAIQGLNQKVEEQQAELQQKQTELEELKQRLDILEKIIYNQKPR